LSIYLDDLSLGSGLDLPQEVFRSTCRAIQGDCYGLPDECRRLESH
jgi:hypothetical protein